MCTTAATAFASIASSLPHTTTPCLVSILLLLPSSHSIIPTFESLLPFTLPPPSLRLRNSFCPSPLSLSPSLPLLFRCLHWRCLYLHVEGCGCQVRTLRTLGTQNFVPGTVCCYDESLSITCGCDCVHPSDRLCPSVLSSLTLTVGPDKSYYELNSISYIWREPPLRSETQYDIEGKCKRRLSEVTVEARIGAAEWTMSANVKTCRIRVILIF
jgi:hypothetical protein